MLEKHKAEVTGYIDERLRNQNNERHQAEIRNPCRGDRALQMEVAELRR